MYVYEHVCWAYHYLCKQGGGCGLPAKVHLCACDVGICTVTYRSRQGSPELAPGQHNYNSERERRAGVSKGRGSGKIMSAVQRREKIGGGVDKMEGREYINT